MDIEEPKLQKARIEVFSPCITRDLNESEDPKLAKDKTERALPRRVADLIDMLLPTFTIPRSEAAPCRIVF
jgi:hypothetical protein